MILFSRLSILPASADGEAAGMLVCSTRPNLFHAAPAMLIEELIVKAAYRRQGLGRALLEEALARAQRLGCAEISVSTGLENERAQALYRSAGLVEEYLLLEKHF